ncbi:hypothetical protein ASF83_00690 [Plantibacter sp. Leaf171]|uniref:hypothetical protein n=1 Tax=unclassified Plantibacter TaxID=2624265 RepID=UPI0006F70964|nr:MULTISPECIES: hypothetical protein [unclassified Plantibacter]KQM17673.1 hypothetical protein ASE44_00705 [Plantibacter sp. Leaf1]KQR60454.1 hypothetical protein ASF83_00690 [Plantibacter sp. Leaf171]
MTDVFEQAGAPGQDQEAATGRTGLGWRLAIGGTVLVAGVGAVLAIVAVTGGFAAADPAAAERAMERCIEEQASRIVDAGDRTPEEAAAEGCALQADSDTFLDEYGD